MARPCRDRRRIDYDLNRSDDEQECARAVVNWNGKMNDDSFPRLRIDDDARPFCLIEFVFSSADSFVVCRLALCVLIVFLTCQVMACDSCLLHFLQ